MHLKLKTLLLFTYYFSFGFSQQVKVVNEFYEPIENVAIYTPSNTKSTKTNYKGVADISNFNVTDTLYFYTEGYQFYWTTIDQLIIDSSFDKSTISVDYFSKSKQGDISTNLFIVLK